MPRPRFLLRRIRKNRQASLTKRGTFISMDFAAGFPANLCNAIIFLTPELKYI
jgi:hypothetical protein